MKILLLGSLGNLGTQLEAVFSIDRRHQFLAWDRLELDITNAQQVQEKITAVAPDIIINATAYNAVDKCESEPLEFELAKNINGLAVKNLAIVARQLGAVLVHYSTDYVFPGDQPEGYTESDFPGPINNYGQSKLLGERAVLELGRQGLKYYLIRTSKLFGPAGRIATAKPSFFDIMLKAAQEKSELEVVDEELSCFTYTPDLALWTKELVESQLPFGIYHLVNSRPATWYAAAQELFKIKGINVTLKPVPSDQFPRPAKRPLFSVLLNTKTNPGRSYLEALKDYLLN